MLRIGRMKESIYNRSVLKQLHNDKHRILPDAARTIIVEGWTLAAERIVTNMVNTFAAERAYPAMITLSAVLPEGTEEKGFRRFTSRLGSLCADSHIRITVADVRVLPQAGTPVFTAVGLTFEGNLKPMERLSADLDILVAGTIACEGAAILALEKERQLRERFAGFFVDTATQLFDSAAMPMIRDILNSQDVSGIAVREGGIFAGLWELGSVGKVGLDINLKSIPIRQHTVEVCEFCNINPYMLLSGGCILLAATRGKDLAAVLSARDIPAAVIGHTTSGNDRIIRYDDEIRYLEPPKTDEIYTPRGG